MKRIRRVAFLATIWVLLWGRLSVANVASGILVATFLLVVYSPIEMAPSTTHVRIRPLHLAWLFVYIAKQLVVSNAVIARDIVMFRSTFRTGIVACPLKTDSRRVVTFVANVLSLSPGIIPVHVQTEPPLIYVHVLRLRSVEDTRRTVAKLEQLRIQAFDVRPIEAVTA